MADDTGQPGRSGDGQRNPWAPPDESVPAGKGKKAAQQQIPEEERQHRQVAEQPTVTSGPGAAPPTVPPAPGAGSGVSGSGSASGYGPSSFGSAPVDGRQYGAQPYGQPDPSSPYGYPSAAPAPAPYGYGYGPYGWSGAPLPQGKSVASMVLGIVSMVLVCSCWGSFLAVVTAPVAVGLGLAARRGVTRGEQGGRGQAVAGLVMGILGTALSAIIITVIVLMFTVFEKDLRDSDPDNGGGGSSIDARGGVSLVLGAS